MANIVTRTERLNTVKEAAEKLAQSPRTTWSWIYGRRIGVHRIGRSVRVPESEIRRILSEGYVPPMERVQ